jgi:hypothetical protein
MGEFRVLMSEIRCLQFSSLQSASGLHHAITTRYGGCSRVPYESLNLGYHVNDDALGVSHNRKRLANLLRYDATQLVAAQQVHGARIQIVDANSCGSGALDWDSALPETDALIVAEPNVPVLILVADCAPLLLVDKKHRVLAVYMPVGAALCRALLHKLSIRCTAHSARSHSKSVSASDRACAPIVLKSAMK